MPILDKEISVFPQRLFEDPVYDLDRGDRNWWAIFTRSRHEKALARALSILNVPFFLPLASKRHVIRKRVVRSYCPLFGGYVFMFSNDAERSRALATGRIVELLEVKNQRQLRDDLRQLHRLIQTGVPVAVESRLRPGRRVRVRNGAMRGLEGIVVERRGGQRRLIVAVEFLQNGVSLEIDDDLVEPV